MAICAAARVGRWPGSRASTARARGAGAADLAAVTSVQVPNPRDQVVRVIQAVGNCGQIHDRHFGPNTPITLPRGRNNLVSKGGLHYPVSFR
jgi:hypothetical protein